MKSEEFLEKKESGVPCDCEDGAVMRHVFNPGGLSVCFKGDGWMDKIHKENAYRERRSQKMAARQKKNHKTPELVPNYGGQEVEDWREAKNLAEKDGRISETYDTKIEPEE